MNRLEKEGWTTNIDRVMMLVTAAVAGLLGSVGMGLCLQGRVAWAQSEAKAPQVIRAERFELVDKTGKTRAELTLDEKDRDATSLRLRDHEGKVRVELTVAANGTPFISLYDSRQSTLRVNVHVDNDGKPSIALMKESSEVIWKAP